MGKVYHRSRFYTTSYGTVPFFLCPKNGMEIYQTLRVERFKHPICIDEGDYLNKLNHFPADMAFQTFCWIMIIEL